MRGRSSGKAASGVIAEIAPRWATASSRASRWPAAASAGDQRSPALAPSAFQEASNISAFPQALPGSKCSAAARGGLRDTCTHAPAPRGHPSPWGKGTGTRHPLCGPTKAACPAEALLQPWGRWGPGTGSLGCSRAGDTGTCPCAARGALHWAPILLVASAQGSRLAENSERDFFGFISGGFAILPLR